MSDYLSSHSLQEYLEKLVQRSGPNLNDVTHWIYVEGGRQALQFFGKEQLLLLGSTGEKLKLKSDKDAGDMDILLSSGKLEIPAKNIEFREDTPCFVWIKADNLNSNLHFDLVDGKYLPSSLLRHIGTELFTIGRGLFHIFTRATDYIRHNRARNTIFRHGSKVGLSTTEYLGLQFVDEFSPELRRLIKRLKVDQSMNAKANVLERLQDVEFNQKDINCLDVNLIELLRLLKAPGSTGANEGQFQHLIHILDLGLQRVKEIEVESKRASVAENSSLQNEGFQSNDEQHGDLPDNNLSESDDDTWKKFQNEIAKLPDKVDATYLKKRSKDFVPALKIAGKLPCLDAWKNRERVWPSKEIVEDICNMDVYVVSKFAPKDPDFQKDFCLSFNRAELKLSESMSAVQRKVFLVLKSYLKGMIANEYKRIDRELRLTTFHLKTALYWVIGDPAYAAWTEADVSRAIQDVLAYLINALVEKNLQHFFLPSNLLAGFDDDDFTLLLECFLKIQADPVVYIEDFFTLDDDKPEKVQFNKEEILELLDVPFDDVVIQEADIAVDALVDIQRGFNEGPRDLDGNAPIKNAILAIIVPHIEIEYQLKLDRWINLANQSDDKSLLLKEAMIMVEGHRDHCLSELYKYISCSDSDTEEKDKLRNNVFKIFQKYFHLRH